MSRRELPRKTGLWIYSGRIRSFNPDFRVRRHRKSGLSFERPFRPISTCEICLSFQKNNGLAFRIARLNFEVCARNSRITRLQGRWQLCAEGFRQRPHILRLFYSENLHSKIIGFVHSNFLSFSEYRWQNPQQIQGITNIMLIAGGTVTFHLLPNTAMNTVSFTRNSASIYLQ